MFFKNAKDEELVIRCLTLVADGDVDLASEAVFICDDIMEAITYILKNKK